MKEKTQIQDLAKKIYDSQDANLLIVGIARLIKKYRLTMPKKTVGGFTQEDIILITYGDMVQKQHEKPLETLADFLVKYAADYINTVHLLPFFPFSSDDGFSVIDFGKVNPEMGEWHHIEQIGQNFKLMADLVLNHISAQSDWFQAFLRNELPYTNYFITVDEEVDLSQVVRPRALPLLSEFNTDVGMKRVWTTFSDDQIDLNYKNPQVLLEMLEFLCLYAQKGVDIVRLDAVAYIWKEIGTSCIHLPQAHAIVQLMRAVLDEIAPWVKLVTETNVPHKDNIGYFGDGRNEAQMVYNFSLPPLVLHSFISQNALKLSAWAETLEVPSKQTTFFNFLASHDGIGITPSLGILDDSEISAILERVQSLDGYISYKNNPDGSQSPYELNINFLDALSNPELSPEDNNHIVRRFLTSQAIMLSLRGVPGCYFHSLVGSRGWHPGVTHHGHARAINRQKLDYSTLVRSLSDIGSRHEMIYEGYKNLLKQRKMNRAFHPQGEQRIIDLDEKIFAILRISPDEKKQVLCLHNVSEKDRRILIHFDDLLSGKVTGIKSLFGNVAAVLNDQKCDMQLEAYQTAWLEMEFPHSNN